MEYIYIILICYLIGSFPTAYVIGKVLKKKDIRNFGSGNVGTTNAFRVLGKKYGVITLVVDLLKAFLPVFIIGMVFKDKNYIDFQLAAGFSVIIGHIFTIFLKFKGGKGVACACGFLFAVTPVSMALTVLIFLLSLFISKYVSLSSIIASISYPVFVVFLDKNGKFIIISIILALIIILKHQTNIKRLINGTENKVPI